eukprot:7638132-Heterocapsa_arctica.AAC.1
MTDSCVDGAGVIATTATREEIVEEERFAETRGWTASLRDELDEYELGEDPTDAEVEAWKRSH